MRLWNSRPILRFVDTTVVNRAGKAHDKTLYNFSPGVWSQILPFEGHNVLHNSSCNSSYSPKCNGWHHLSLIRKMAEEQLRTWSYQPDLSLFLICIHATVTCSLHMFRLHGWTLMLYLAADDFTAGSAPWALGAALVHFWKADYSRAVGAVILQTDLYPLPLCPDILCCFVYAVENICEGIGPRWKILANSYFSQLSLKGKYEDCPSSSKKGKGRVEKWDPSAAGPNSRLAVPLAPLKWKGIVFSVEWTMLQNRKGLTERNQIHF